MNTVRVTDLVYEDVDEQPVVTIAARGIDGTRYELDIHGVDPYFFVPEDDHVPSREEVVRVEEEYESYDNIPLQKVVTRIPGDVKEIRDDYEDNYEADVPFRRRTTSDRGLSGYIEIPEGVSECDIEEINTDVEVENNSVPIRSMLVDIETEPPETTDQWDDYVKNAPGAVLMITTYDSYSGEYLCLALDEEKEIEPSEIRTHLEEHWEGHEDEEFYTDCEIRFRRCDTEVELLEAFIQEVKVKEPDVLSGWNFTDFDAPYLLNRMENKSEISYHDLQLIDSGFVKPWLDENAIPGLPCFDMMRSFCEQMSYGEWRSKSLDYVSGEELDAGKVEGDSIMEEYNERRSKFMAYNLIDVQLCVGIDKKHGVFEFFYELANICGCQISDTASEMRLVESFLFSHRDDTEILPTTQEADMQDATGGLVLNPSNDIYDWVAVLDLKSLYPSSIISLNISRETIGDTEGYNVVIPSMPLNDDKVSGEHITEDDINWVDGTAVNLQNRGLIPKYIGKLFRERDNFKEERDEYDTEDPQYEVYDNKQRGIKVVQNSFFGVSDNKYFRLSTEGMGDAITGSSRYVTWKGTQIAEDMGYEVIYGDTDSIFVSLAMEDEDITEEEVVERGKELEHGINERMEEVADDFGIPDKHPHLDGTLHGTGRHLWQWEFEKGAVRWLQTGSKKRYASLLFYKEGQYLDDADPSISGYEAERSSSPTITEDFQTEMFDRILSGQSFEEISGFVQSFVDGLQDKSIKEVALPGVLNKPPEEYPNRPVPRACEYSNEHLGSDFREGDNPFVLYVKDTPPNLPSTDEIAVRWDSSGVPDGFTIDYSRHIQKHMQQPMKSILEVTPWSFSELRAGKQTQAAFEGSSSTSNPFSSSGGSSNPNPFSD